jgi:hypothetical protein
MILKILAEAEAELDDAISGYEAIVPGLGIRLKEEAKTVVSWIANHPEFPRIRRHDYRRVNFKIFPYYIAYVIHDQIVWILAIAHTARRPEYWISRTIPE